ncbi:hypothetical protein BKA62DRAFT_747595 [Auriculariales sp. MPI-PUGE-AT-0066]|nr:hypothetical protein BKA62DRAFT_747595 [Auriculariales sp. MPI-PUGE-AT-0066]
MVASKQNTTRPALPLAHANQFLQLQAGPPPSVKFQVITRESQDIVVGRVKIETPGSHAFILRRFDTGALSLKTMFRAAFPEASEDAEKSETAYIKNAYEPPGTNGAPSGRLRLAGTWITPQCAEAIAPEYNLREWISALIHADPDLTAVYRRSSRPSNADSPSQTAVESPPPTSRHADTATSGVPNKRQRISSPAQHQPAPSSATTRRVKSPAATPARPTRATRNTPSRSMPARATRASLAATTFQPLTYNDTQDEVELEIGGQDPEDGLAEGKAIFDEVAASYVPSSVNTARKRTAAEPDEIPMPTMLNLDGPGLQVARPIASNNRINFELNAEQKALAWGTLAFAFGMGLTSFVLPMFS